MKTITAHAAWAMLDRVLDEIADSHEPVRITGPRATGVLVSDEYWRSIQETLYLLSIPGLRESIHAAAREPLDACSDSCFE